MRIGVIVVSMLVLTTASEASESCMTKAEARQHFGSVHIYWHGKDHCWDATPGRRHGRIHTVRQKDRLDTVQQTVQQKIHQPSWHDSMSEMLPDEAPVRTPWVAAQVAPQVDIEPPQLSPPQFSMAERWVDIAQVAPPRIIRKPEPMVTPRGVVMVIVFITLMLAIVMIFEHPRSRRNTPAAG
ncbi:MAG TPA: hypothetical protein VK635_18540 [Bradyrhizobium sp.]|jgi:hypothetical protein|nr:hypothetical protein [Bradyrhizobium sp.]HTG06038.1 hypothetical protein [Bradyrhizobium sp.]